MGEAKRNKVRLGEWYGKKIVPGHPDCPPPKPKPSYEAPPPIPQTIVAEVPSSFQDNTDDILQVDQTPRGEQTIEFLPAAENVAPARRPMQSKTYRRVNLNAGMALLCMVGTIGTTPTPEDKS